MDDFCGNKIEVKVLKANPNKDEESSLQIPPFALAPQLVDKNAPINYAM